MHLFDDRAAAQINRSFGDYLKQQTDAGRADTAAVAGSLTHIGIPQTKIAGVNAGEYLPAVIRFNRGGQVECGLGVPDDMHAEGDADRAAGDADLGAMLAVGPVVDWSSRAGCPRWTA